MPYTPRPMSHTPRTFLLVASPERKVKSPKPIGGVRCTKGSTDLTAALL